MHPRLRRVESFPISQPDGQTAFALRDPEGFAGSIVLPYQAAVLASLLDGTRSLIDVQQELGRKFGQPVDLADVESLVHQLDQRDWLDNERFRARWKQQLEQFLNSPVRPAAHAGGAYPAEPAALREHLSALFTGENGPGAPIVETAASGALCGVLSPHIDLQRGGTTFAWAYKRVVEQSQADLFVIFGTAHNPMRNLFSLTKKDFHTPLGTVETDRKFVARLASQVKQHSAADETNLFADELAHRREHSIEFQVLFLQYLLGDRRPFKIVPVLVGSFHEFVAARNLSASAPHVSAFVRAMQKTVSEHPGRVCYISGGDLAHIGQRFGDREFLDRARLTSQAENDRRLLEAACRCDSQAFFGHVAADRDQYRVCGLSPTYTMLEVMRPKRGELLRYDQAVELDGTSCVSFASLAFYGE